MGIQTRAISVVRHVCDRIRVSRWWLRTSWIVVCLLYLREARHFAYTIVRQWPTARGYEYEWIASTLASGHGYAFSSGHMWLGPYPDGSLSAWTDPFQTFIIAASFYLFGEYGRLVLVLLNVLWVVATALVVALCCRRASTLNISLLTAASFFLGQLHISNPWLYIGNVALAMFLFSLCALCLIRALEASEFRRVLTLGVVIGITNLAHAASILFGPAAAAILLARWGVRRAVAWRSAVAVTVLPLMIVAPWAARNYLTFHEFVPIRTGFGWQLYIGNVALAMTLAEDRSDNRQAAPPWTATSPREAVRLIRDLDHEAALRGYARELEVAKAPVHYASYNEAQRDRYFGSLAAAFMGENPGLVAQLVFWRLQSFLFGWDVFTTIITLCALAGILARWRDLRAVGLCALICVYTLPYALSVVFYFRYRAPIDPIMFMLIGFLLSATHTIRPNPLPADSEVT